MKGSQTNNIIFKLITLSNILFVSLFVVLSYHNRITSDDFYAIALHREKGILGGVTFLYNTWTGRWAACFLNLFLIKFYSFKYFLFVYGSMVFILFVFSVKRLLHNIIELFHFNSLSFWKELNIAVFVVSAIFYCSIKIDETWFFFSSTCVYLVSMLFFMLGTSALIARKNQVLDILILIVSFAYIGGSCEPFALIILLFLMLFVFLNDFGILPVDLPKKQFAKKLFVAFITCLASFVILYIADGNRVREHFFRDISIFETIFLNIKTTGMIILLRLPVITPFVILFTVPVYYFGSLRASEDVIKKNIKLRIGITMFFYFALLYIYQFPITYITQDIGAYRALFPVTVFTLITFATIFYNIGLAGFLKLQEVGAIVIVVLITICCINTYALVSQSKMTSVYSKAYDDRIEFLKRNRNNNQALLIIPLPSSGLLYSAEISSDTSYFVNQHLKKGLGLRSPVILLNTGN